MSFRCGTLPASGLGPAVPMQPPRAQVFARGYGGGRGRGGGARRGDGLDGSGLILGPGASELSPEFAEHLNKSARKIIIPGGPSRPTGAPAKLIVPSKEKRFAGILDESDTVTTPTEPAFYRPPAGFMNEELIPDEAANLDAQDMLSRLQSRAGRWYTLAKYIPALYKQNFDSTSVDEITGINPLQQSKWVVAGTIYESLKLSGKVSAEVMEAFNFTGDDLLYPLRFLGTDMRIAAANYLVEQKLGPVECDVLARSMKEWERRTSERYGFSDHPGDCLAFKYMRDALETKTRKALEQKAELGLKVAVTESARQRLRDILVEEGAEATVASPGVSAASMLLLRLSEDEIGYRTMPVLGEYNQVRALDFENVPRSSQEGAFGVFTLTGSTAASVRWVALPQWRALAMAQLPVALEVTDCSKVQSILTGTKIKTDEDRKRLQGPGLLVLDCQAVKCAAVREDTYYAAIVVAGAAGGLSLSLAPGLERVEIVPGGTLKASNRNALATLLFICRPPIREALQAATESSQLQV